MRFPAPTRRDHVRFCEVEGWRLVRSAIGKRNTHHETYELELPDGAVLRTRVSRPPDRTDHGDALWGHILRDQLRVSAEEFWRCVQDGVPPDRGIRRVTGESIPADLLYLLKQRVGLADAQLSDMTRQEAIERIQQYWAAGEYAGTLAGLSAT